MTLNLNKIKDFKTTNKYFFAQEDIYFKKIKNLVITC